MFKINVHVDVCTSIDITHSVIETVFKINVVTILPLHVLLMLTLPLDCTAFAAGDGGNGGKKKKAGDVGSKSKDVGDK